MDDDPTVRYAIKSVDALRRSSLEFTGFVNGFFMDYWGMPHIPSNLWAYTWAIDIANKRAAIPGTGDDVLSLTYSVDVAKFVVRTLESSDKWPETSIVSGSDITFNQLLAIAERIRGTTPSGPRLLILTREMRQVVNLIPSAIVWSLLRRTKGPFCRLAMEVAVAPLKTRRNRWYLCLAG